MHVYKVVEVVSGGRGVQFVYVYPVCASVMCSPI